MSDFRLPLVPSLLAVIAPLAINAAESEAPSSEDVVHEVVLTVDRRPQALDRVAGTIQVIDRQDNAAQGYPVLMTDLLRQVPGVQVLPSGGRHGASGLRLRGAAAGDTMLMIDGIPFEDASTLGGANPSISHLNAAGLERIEISQGAQSGVYGSRAQAGVMHIITVRPTEVHRSEVLVEGGTLGAFAARAQATGPIADRLGYAVSAGYLEEHGISAQLAEGDSSRNARHYEADGVRRSQVRGRLEYALDDERSHLYLSAAWSQADLDYDSNVDLFDPDTFDFIGSFPDPDDRDSIEEITHFSMAMGGRVTVADTWHIAADASWSEYRRSYPNETSPWADRRFDSTTHYAAAQVGHDLSDELTLSLGGDWRWQQADVTATDGTTSFRHHQHLVGIWGQIAWEDQDGTSHWTLSGRHDEHSREGGASTMRLSTAQFFADQDLKIFAAVGTGFRAPGLYDLYSSWGGNPDLKAETTTTYEIGQRLRIGDHLELTTTAFRSEYHRRIVFDWGLGQSVNEGAESHINGVEIGLRYHDDQRGLGAGLDYTGLRTRAEGGGAMAYTPQHVLQATIQQRWGPVQARLALRHVRDQNDGAGDPLEAHTVVDVAASWQPRSDVEVYARIDNLTNADYVVMRNEFATVEAYYATPGIVATLGAVLRF